MDEAGARVRLKSMTQPPDLKSLEADIARLDVEKEEAVGAQDFERAAQLRDSAQKQRRKKEQLLREWRESTKRTDGVVDEDVIRETVSKMTGVPLTRLEKAEAERPRLLEDRKSTRLNSSHTAKSYAAFALKKKQPPRPTYTPSTVCST